MPIIWMFRFDSFWTVMALDVVNFVGANPDTCVLGDFHQTLQE